MITVVAWTLVVAAVTALAVGWVVTERDIARKAAYHKARHAAVVAAAVHVPTVWPEYQSGCERCRGGH